MAIPLLDYLDVSGRYDGFDIIEELIEWCDDNISSKFENFSFYHADIYSKYYNPNGKLTSSEYTFPYIDESFDLVFLASVFTHLTRKTVVHYLSEITRVMRPSSQCLMTFFLMNPEANRSIENGESYLDFPIHKDGQMYNDKNFEESAVGYDEEEIISLLHNYRLDIELPIHYGSWCGCKRAKNFQDILVATKMSI